MTDKKEQLKKEVDKLNSSLRRASTPNELYDVFKNYKYVISEYSEFIDYHFGDEDYNIEADIEAAMRSKTGKNSKYYREAYNALSLSINEIPI